MYTFTPSNTFSFSKGKQLFRNARFAALNGFYNERRTYVYKYINIYMYIYIYIFTIIEKVRESILNGWLFCFDPERLVRACG